MTALHKTLHFVQSSGSPSQQAIQGPGSAELRFQTGPRSRAPSEPRDSDSAHCLGPSCYLDALRATGAGDVVRRVGVTAVGSRSGDCCPPFRADGASAALEDDSKPTVSFFFLNVYYGKFPRTQKWRKWHKDTQLSSSPLRGRSCCFSYEPSFPTADDVDTDLRHTAPSVDISIGYSDSNQNPVTTSKQ